MTNPVQNVQVNYVDGVSSLSAINLVQGVTVLSNGNITVETTSEGLDVVFHPPENYSLSQVTITYMDSTKESGPDGAWVQVENLKALCQNGSVHFQDLNVNDQLTYSYDLTINGSGSLEKTLPKLPDPRLENKGTT